VDAGRVAGHEHLAFQSELDLESLCAKVRIVLDLPPFEFGEENATEWGSVTRDGVEYNVSMPYEDGTLQEWDATVPPECNVGLTLLVSREHPRAGDREWIIGTLVRDVGARLAAGLGREIVHHRTSQLMERETFRPHRFARGAAV
jgi:hypothetical protein